MTKLVRFFVYFIAFLLTITFLGTLIFGGEPAPDPEVHRTEILIWTYLVLFGLCAFFFVGIGEVIATIVDKLRKKTDE